MTQEEIEKIYCEVYGHVNCDLSPQFEEFLVRLGVKIDEPEEKIELTKSQICKSIASVAKEKASKADWSLNIMTPNGQESIESAWGIDLIMEENKLFLEKLGFKE